MKIGIIATFLGQQTSGAEISAYLLASNLKKNNEVFVVTTKVTADMPFHCYTLPFTKHLPNLLLLIGSSLLDKLMERELYKLFRKEKPDIIHVQDPSIMIASIKAARRLNIPIITTIRDYRFACNLSIPLEQGIIPFQHTKKEYKSWLKESLQQSNRSEGLTFLLLPWFYSQNKRLREYSQKFDYYLTVSDFVKNQLIKAGIPASKIETIKVQRPDWELLPDSAEKESPIIFTAGGLKATKGFDFLIESFRLVVDKHPEVKLRIAGEGSNKEKLIQLTKKLDLENNVQFVGRLSYEQMRKEYGNSTFVVSPSLWPEPLTRIIFETFAMKKTIIATDVGGSSELVMPGKTGMLVQPRDNQGLAAAMNKLLEDDKLRVELAENAYKLINKECNNEKVISNHLEVYKKLIK